MKVNEAQKTNPLKNERGIAMFEGLVFMVAFVILTIYVFDTFTAIHTGIVNSIGARTYLFETLQHRSNIRYLRYSDEQSVNGRGPGSKEDFRNPQAYDQRFHVVTDEDESIDGDNSIKNPARRLTGVKSGDQGRQMSSTGSNSSSNKTSIIYIKEGYGICLDAGCPAGPGG